MSKRRIAVTALILAVLCLLVYLQVRTWKRFDWPTFWSQTRQVSLLYVAMGVALTYGAYVVRAVRWRIFLKPVKETTTARLIGPQFIGFTGLALLGRAGELIRPYLVARKEERPFSSQIAVLLVERIFDMTGVAILFTIGTFVGDSWWPPAFQRRVELSAALLFALVFVGAVVAVVLRFSGEWLAQLVRRIAQPVSGKLATALESKIATFGEGLKTINDFASFVQLLFLSIGMWLMIVMAYWSVTHSYGGPLAHLGIPSLNLLMVSSMAGSVIQLPGVGGGSQLATISMLSTGFGIEKELATSCGMLLWATTFMSVIPMGLLLAHREQISLRAVAAEEEKQAAALAD